MVRKKWFISLLVFVLIFSNFINSTLFVSTGYAAGNETTNYEDGEYSLPVSVLHATKAEASIMGKYVEKESSKVFIQDGKAEVHLTLTSSDMIPSFQVEHNGKFVETAIESKNEENNTRVISFDVDNLDQILNGKVSVDTKNPQYGAMAHDVRLQFDTSNLPKTNKESNDEIKEDPEKGPENADKNDSGTEKNESIPNTENNESDKGEKPSLNLKEDGAYTFSYTTEGADLGRYYQKLIALIVQDGKQYIQLTGNNGRQFVDFLYIDGKKMDVSASQSDGTYIAQMELNESLESKNQFTFNMVLNTPMGLMSHESKVTIDLATIKEANNEGFKLINDTTKPNETNIVQSNEKSTYLYTTDGANIDRFYEDKIDIVKKDNKQYLQLNGTGMHQFVEALYIDGKRMAVGPRLDETGTYKAQIEIDPLSEKSEFNFVMLINARGTIMMHQTKIKVLQDGDYSIDYDALYQDKDEPSTAAKYFVNPTKLTVKDGKAKLFIKLTDHEVIKDLKVKKDGKFVSAKVEKTNEKANTRIVSFDIDNLTDVMNAQVKVYVDQLDYTSEQPFRIKLKGDTIKDYDGILEKEDPEKPKEFKDGKYTINYRVIKDGEFEKSEIGKLLKAPASIVLKGDKKTVTITVDNDKVKGFQIEKGNKFVDTNIVKVDEKNNTRDISFDIDAFDTVVTAKISVASTKARSAVEEHIVKLFFEENSVQFVGDEDDKNDEKKELVADEAYTLGYTIKHGSEDKPSSANNYFTGQAVLLKYGNEEYVQISTHNNSGPMINWLKNKLGDKYVDVVVVEDKNDDKTFQFKLDNRPLSPLTPEWLQMEIEVPNVYKDTHEARLFFDTTTQNEVDPKNYRLIASTNANGPDGENAVNPGGNAGGGKPPVPPKPNPEPKPKPSKPSKPKNAIDVDEAYKLHYVIKHEKEDKESVANSFFTGEAYILHKGNEKYAQIATKDGSGKYIDSFRNKIDSKYEEMVVVEEKKNGDKILQFKLNGPGLSEVLLDMVITVPGIYENEYHKARLVFDTTEMKEVDPSNLYLVPSTNANGPDGKGAVTPEPRKAKGTNEKDEKLGKPEFGTGITNESKTGTKETTNPKTSDKTKIYLYAFLLVAAGGVLYFQLRRRFAKQ